MMSAGRRDATVDLGLAAESWSVAGLADAELLERFAFGDGRAAESAFESIVSKHGPMVFGVCRAILRDQADAEDAFQATFLVLVRRAGSVRVADSLAPWLGGVARRVATKARAAVRRRRSREIMAGPDAAAVPDDPAAFDARRVLWEELDRLPVKYREPIALCHLGGLTHEEAARHLRWPIGTLSGRLSRARDLLRRRLTLRGLGDPAAPVLTLLSTSPAARPVPSSLFRSTLRATATYRAGGILPAPILSLTRGVAVMMLDKFRLALILIPGLAGLALAIAGPRPGRLADPLPPPAPALVDRPFGEKWERVIPSPMPELGDDHYVAWVERGWLQARRETADGLIVWHVVLGRAAGAQPPTIEAKAGTVRFALSYRDGRYSVREDLNLLKCVREPKQGRDDWPAVNLDIARDVRKGSAGGLGQPPMLQGWLGEAGFVVTSASGPTEDRRDCFVRLAPSRQKEGAFSFSAMAGPQRRADWGENWLIDDGEMMVAQMTTEAMIGLEVGDEAPPLTGTTLEGKPLDLAAYRGRYVLIDFWATWCGPGVEELPRLQAVRDMHLADDRFAMIGVSFDEGDAAPRRLVAERDIRWPQLIAPGGSGGPIAKAYRTYSIPGIFLIGPDGKIVARGLRGEQIARAVDRALEKK